MRYAPYAKAGATAPEVVRDVGHGSLEKGSRVLDLFVGKVRDAAQHWKLPPPKTNTGGLTKFVAPELFLRSFPGKKTR